MDNDGRLDLFAGGFRYVASDEPDRFDEREQYHLRSHEVTTHPADVDGDGDFDLVSVYSSLDNSRIDWYELNDQGSYTHRGEFIDGQASAFGWQITVSDLNGDRRDDVLLYSGSNGEAQNELTIWRTYDDELRDLGPPIQVGQISYYVTSILAADFDGDHLPDLVTSLRDCNIGSGCRQWLSIRRSLGEHGDFTERNFISSLPGEDGYELAAGDVDNDSDLDLILENGNGWYENLTGEGTFGPLKTITTGTTTVVDLNRDGAVDTLAIDAKIVLWSYDTASGAHQRRDLTMRDFGFANSKSVTIADVDGDGDLDVVVLGNNLNWSENLDGELSYGESQLIHERTTFESVSATDIDGDGDDDLVVRNRSGTTWWIESQGAGKFSDAIPIEGLRWDRRSRLTIADLDDDGDMDFTTSSPSAGVVWVENLDGLGSFSTGQTLDWRFGAMTHADIDQDGDLDLLMGRVGVLMLEKRLIGDANDDGLFDLLDLMQVLRSAKYEDGAPRNASFGEGDWNGDGEFTSSDLVAAFKFGAYAGGDDLILEGPIPAAVDSLFHED